MNTTQALNTIHANLAVIGSEALLHNRLAMEVQTAYARFCQHPDDANAGVSLVKAAEEWELFMEHGTRV